MILLNGKKQKDWTIMQLNCHNLQSFTKNSGAQHLTIIIIVVFVVIVIHSHWFCRPKMTRDGTSEHYLGVRIQKVVLAFCFAKSPRSLWSPIHISIMWCEKETLSSSTSSLTTSNLKTNNLNDTNKIKTVIDTHKMKIKIVINEKT